VNPSALLLIIVAFAFLYFVLVRPQKRRQATQSQMLGSLKEGDEIVTAGGIYGEITGFQDDDLLVRIAPELEVRIARRAVGGVVSPPADDAAEDEPESADEPETAAEPEPVPVEEPDAAGPKT
jgi:preprotein translocase subunit YajC